MSNSYKIIVACFILRSQIPKWVAFSDKFKSTCLFSLTDKVQCRVKVRKWY